LSARWLGRDLHHRAVDLVDGLVGGCDYTPFSHVETCANLDAAYERMTTLKRMGADFSWFLLTDKATGKVVTTFNREIEEKPWLDKEKARELFEAAEAATARVKELLKKSDGPDLIDELDYAIEEAVSAGCDNDHLSMARLRLKHLQEAAAQSATYKAEAAAAAKKVAAAEAVAKKVAEEKAAAEKAAEEAAARVIKEKAAKKAAEDKAAADAVAAEKAAQEEQRRLREEANEEAIAAAQRLQEEQERRKEEARKAERQLEESKIAAQRQVQEELEKERERVHAKALADWESLNRQYPIPEFLKKYVTKVLEDAEAHAAQERFYNIGVVGNSGVGKSSLIEKILEHFRSSPPEDMVISSEGDGTLDPTPFELAGFNGIVRVWDLPGQGTEKFPSKTYVRDMGLKYFDSIVVVTSGRWTENDQALLQAIHAACKFHNVVRTKIDQAVEDGMERGRTEKMVLDQVRSKLLDQLQLLDSSCLHLISNRKKTWDNCSILLV